MLNLSADRYRFAVGLGAALLRGHTSLLPPNHVADTVARLRARFAGVYALVDGARGDGHGLPTVAPRRRRAPTRRRSTAIPAIDRRPGRRPRADVGLDRRAGAARQAVGHCWSATRAPRRAGWPPRWAARPGRRHAGRDRAGAAHVRLRVERPARAARRRGVRLRAAVLSGRHRRRARPRRRAARAGDDAVPPEDGARRRASRCRRSTSSVCATAPLSPQLAARAEQRSARRCSRSTAAPKPARWRRGAPPPAPSGAPSTASALDGDGDARDRQRRPRAAADRRSPTCSRSSTPQTLPPARPLERPDQHRRQAQLDRPPRTSTSTRSRASSTARSGCRPRATPTRRRRPPGRLRRRAAARARARSSPRCASASTRRSCRAASSTSTRCRARPTGKLTRRARSRELRGAPPARPARR